MSSIMTSIRQVDGGSVIKSGDTSSVFKFEILDDDFVKKDLTGTGKLAIFNLKNVILYQDVTVESGSFSFKFDKVVAPGYYKLEIKLDGYVFPTGDFDIRVRPSFNPSNSVPESTEDPKIKALAEEVRKHLDNDNVDELPDLLTIYNLAKI